MGQAALPLRAGVKFTIVTSGLHIAGQVKVCEFTQMLAIFDNFTGTDLGVAATWVSEVPPGRPRVNDVNVCCQASNVVV